ncbi:YbaY family lipoprotein [Vibrio nomapromontoriensis]|uniref:YbaY family lipoprotein n=1 Tax=Vibrio nomapromontoriensis TaxID=2910246 RepID=UPI003D0D1FAB
MKKIITGLLAVALGLTLAGCQTAPATDAPVTAENSMTAVKGTIAYRERIALPPNAIVTVKLQDVSLADAPATLIAEQTFETDGAQVPFDFELSYNAADIDSRHTYSVSARIEVDGKLRFISDTSYPVITDQNKTNEVNLLLIGVRAK